MRFTTDIYAHHFFPCENRTRDHELSAAAKFVLAVRRTGGGLLPHVRIEIREYVGLPRRDAVERKIVAVICGAAHRRIDPESVQFSEAGELGIERLARIGRVVVRRVDEEQRNGCPTRCLEEAYAQLRRTVPAVARG